jgi:hypothetical protein
MRETIISLWALLSIVGILLIVSGAVTVTGPATGLIGVVLIGGWIAGLGAGS